MGLERSTFFILPDSYRLRKRVAKASQGLVPPPFLITFQIDNELGAK
ncbi:hypothetical protein SAMN03080594_11264 [Arenibacter palladensis]|uniref:Uncharacterized protein n=1 Tax=Arenibacter palladensis TaxID=237373 RepID=A0A1M5GY64_9FLAO|nr:hypothetical protein SAMN03080594_11264 [Arenibacter palladensis]